MAHSHQKYSITYNDITHCRMCAKINCIYAGKLICRWGSSNQIQNEQDPHKYHCIICGKINCNFINHCLTCLMVDCKSNEHLMERDNKINCDRCCSICGRIKCINIKYCIVTQTAKL